MKRAFLFVVLALTAPIVRADVSFVEQASVAAHLARRSEAEAESKEAAKKTHTWRNVRSVSGKTTVLLPTFAGAQSLVDASGLKYFINTDITFATTSSASGAVSEASYVAPVVATTSGGGTVSATLGDAFDGYNSLCISMTGATGPCSAVDPAYLMYNQNGPTTTSCSSRSIVFAPKALGTIQVAREVFIPANDSFARWIDTFTNTGAISATFSIVSANNLGSDIGTTIVSSSSGDAVAQTSDTWISTYQNYIGTTSPDPRLGHVMQGAGATVPLSGVHFANGDDNPYWSYSLTLAPGETKAIMTFATGQPSKAAANAQAAALAQLPATSLQCVGGALAAEIANFAIPGDLAIGLLAPATTTTGSPLTYSLTATNNGPRDVDNVKIVNTLPAGVAYVSTTAPAGWTCSESSGVVTCTTALFATGGSASITINATAPATPTASATDTATISTTGSSPDNVTANNTKSVSTNVVAAPAAVVTATKSVAGDFYPGGAVAYTITLQNLGTATQSDNPVLLKTV